MNPFLVQAANFHFRFEVDQIVIFTSHSVLFFLAVLAHHNNRSLQRGNARENEIHQDKRIGVKFISRNRSYIEDYPKRQNDAKQDDEFPTASETSDLV